MIKAYDVEINGMLDRGSERLFCDMRGDDRPGAPDGMKVDVEGNLYCTGPGGIWVMSPAGEHIGTLLTRAVNMAWGGGEDPEAVEDIERILDIPGVDAVFIGQGDLTQTLGDRVAAQHLVDRALAACTARGIPACTTAYGDDVASRLDQGFKWLAVAADTGLFTTAVKQRLATVR